MKKLLLTCAVSCLAATSCTLTGDPTQGGIFWSPAKAQERQAALQEELDSCNSALESQYRQKDSLISQRKKLSSEINKMEKEVKAMQKSGADNAETQALLKEIARRKAQLDMLR